MIISSLQVAVGRLCDAALRRKTETREIREYLYILQLLSFDGFRTADQNSVVFSDHPTSENGGNIGPSTPYRTILGSVAESAERNVSAAFKVASCAATFPETGLGRVDSFAAKVLRMQARAAY